MPWGFLRPCSASSLEGSPRVSSTPLQKMEHLIHCDAPERASPSMPLHSVYNTTKNRHLLCLSSLDCIPGKSRTEGWSFLPCSHDAMLSKRRESRHWHAIFWAFIQGMCHDSASHQSDLMSITENNSAQLMQWLLTCSEGWWVLVFLRHILCDSEAAGWWHFSWNNSEENL